MYFICTFFGIIMNKKVEESCENIIIAIDGNLSGLSYNEMLLALKLIAKEINTMIKIIEKY